MKIKKVSSLLSPLAKVLNIKSTSAENTYSCDYINNNYAPKDKELFDLIYPINSVYISINSTNPSILFGGQWEQIKDLFLLGAGDTYNAGSTGGEATHTLSINEIPSHNHNTSKQAYAYQDLSYGVDGAFFKGTKRDGYTIPDNTANVGGGQAHNNMPPYLVVYIWKRIG